MYIRFGVEIFCGYLTMLKRSLLARRPSCNYLKHTHFTFIISPDYSWVERGTDCSITNFIIVYKLKPDQ